MSYFVVTTSINQDKIFGINGLMLILLNLLLLLIMYMVWRLFKRILNNKNQYELLANQTPFGIMVVKDRKITFVNHFGKQLLGLSEEKDVVGKPIFTFIHPESHSLALSRLNLKVDHTKIAELMEEKWVKSDNSTINIEVMTIPFINMGEIINLTIFRDITELKQTENYYYHIFKELNDMKLALDISSIVEITDHNGVILYVNEKFSEISQYSAEEVVGKTHRLLKSGHHSREFYKNLWDTILRGKVWDGQVKNRAKDGSHYWVQTLIIPFINSKGEPYQFITIRNNITDRKEAEKEIRFLATHDHLTHLSNRRNFEVELQKAINREEKVAVFFIDLDRFKYINDSLGHSSGDHLIKLVAQRLRELVDRDCIISRQGGDEFTILMKYEDIETILKVARNLIEGIKLPFIVEHIEIFTTCSIGISLYPEHGDDIETLIKNADIAMYWTKDNGKDDFSIYQDHMKERSDKIMRMELDLRKAIENKELILHYQPKIHLGNDEIIGCEALIRWIHPNRGMISPAEFIPLAEETGLINEIGEWVLEEACRQNKRWHEAGFSNLIVAVNMSAYQFKQPNVVGAIERILSETKLEARFLELEITESISMLAEKDIIEKLYELKKVGVSIAIDDFGTGYSSLKYLDKLPVDTLKIDKSFIDRIGEFDYHRSSFMTNAIISLAKSLNLQVVAEGIETEEQVNYLKNNQCEIGQGYFFSRPLPPDLLKDFLILHGNKHEKNS